MDKRSEPVAAGGRAVAVTRHRATQHCAVCRGAPDVSEALHRLGRRAVVTVQVPGSPDGSLHRIELHERGGGERSLAVAWGRFGTPPAVEQARRRR